MISKWQWLFSLLFTLTMLASLAATGQELAIKQTYQGSLTGKSVEEGNMTFTIQKVEEKPVPVIAQVFTIDMKYHLKVVTDNQIITIDGKANFTYPRLDPRPLCEIEEVIGTFSFTIVATNKNEAYVEWGLYDRPLLDPLDPFNKQQEPKLITSGTGMLKITGPSAVYPKRKLLATLWGKVKYIR